MKIIRFKLLTLLLISVLGCNNFIDVVPDNVATLEYAFRMRTTAQKYLATCYSFMPSLGAIGGNVANFGGDELMLNTASSTTSGK